MSHCLHLRNLQLEHFRADQLSLEERRNALNLKEDKKKKKKDKDKEDKKDKKGKKSKKKQFSEEVLTNSRCVLPKLLVATQV